MWSLTSDSICYSSIITLLYENSTLQKCVFAINLYSPNDRDTLITSLLDNNSRCTTLHTDLHATIDCALWKQKHKGEVTGIDYNPFIGFISSEVLSRLTFEVLSLLLTSLLLKTGKKTNVRPQNLFLLVNHFLQCKHGKYLKISL